MPRAKRKRTRKPLYKSTRRSWDMNPKTRVKESKKVFKRSREKEKLDKEKKKRG